MASETTPMKARANTSTTARMFNAVRGADLGIVALARVEVVVELLDARVVEPLCLLLGQQSQ